MDVIGYVRVSTNEQAENGVSLAAQRHRIREYCKANGWKCVEILEDDGYSGKDIRRPGLGMGSLKKPLGALIVAKLDRLTRSVDHARRCFGHRRPRAVRCQRSCLDHFLPWCQEPV